MTCLSISDALELVDETLQRCNTSPVNAASVAEALIAAELVGQTGHGLRRVASYAAQAASGKVDGHATAVADRVAVASLKVDAANGFAYPALDLVQRHLPEMTRECGIAIACISRSHHCGVAGVVVEKLAAEKLVALLFANTPAAMAPWGGSTAVFGTNPIAFAAPQEGKPPVVVDVSLSKVARGKIMAAKQKREPIPEGWAFGPDGASTTDPETALAGTMAPLGDAKGTALAMMVELLAAGVTGANYADEASSFFEPDGPAPGVGQTIIAIDPQKFGGDGALLHLAGLGDKIAQQSGARVPGSRRHDLRKKVSRDGIQIDDELLADIRRIGR